MSRALAERTGVCHSGCGGLAIYFIIEDPPVGALIELLESLSGFGGKLNVVLVKAVASEA